jgi:hypothetical protein
LHLLIAQAGCIRKHGERVALERPRGEDVKLSEWKTFLGTESMAHVTLDSAKKLKAQHFAEQRAW